jgi:drug/metabolite transporter (DMT)-like permease
VLVSTYAYVNPAVAVLLGWAFAGEAVGRRELAAGAVVVASVGMLVLARTQKAPARSRVAGRRVAGHAELGRPLQAPSIPPR